MDWTQVSAVFGGVFDPPHLGHRQAALGLLLNPGVKEVIILPCPAPHYKPAAAALEHRLAMARLNFSHPQIRVDLREMGRRPPIYTFDTLQELRQEIFHLAFVIGSDQLSNFSTWHRFPEILGLSHWIVLERQPDGAKVLEATLREWVASGLIQTAPRTGEWMILSSKTVLKQVPTDAPWVSSTQIRENYGKKGEISRDSLMPEVQNYLETHRLYGA